MANQPKKYKKFVATAATATLVASAIVPVASAAHTDTAGHQFESYINEATELGLFQDGGEFKPQGTLTRKHVALIVGRYLEKAGFKPAADYETNPAFSDLGTDAEYIRLASVVKEAGVFGGDGGKINGANPIKREQMAKVLDGLAKAVSGTSLVEAAKDIEDVKVADLDKAQAGYRDQIQALADLEITTVSTFNPKGNVTRGQFAKFIMTTIGAIEDIKPTPEKLEAAKKAVEEAVKALPALSSITKETAADASAKAAAVATAVAKAEELLEKSSLTAAEKEAVQKELDKAKAAAQAVADKVAEVTKPIGELAVESVNAINATQIEVKFTTAVTKAAAADASNGGAAGNLAKYTVGGANPTAVKLSDDGKTATLTFGAVVEGIAKTVEILPITTAADQTKETAKYAGLLTFKDTVKPTVTKVTAQTGTATVGSVAVDFSEPVVAGATYKLNGTNIPTASVTLNTAGTRATISGLALAPNSTNTLEVIGLTDKATDPNVTITQSVSFTAVADNVAPKATLTTVSDKYIDITFDKSMNDLTVILANIKLTDKAGATVTPTGIALHPEDNGAKKKFRVTLPNLFTSVDSETLTVSLTNNIADALGNKLAPVAQTLAVAKDTVKPTIASTQFVKDVNGNVTKIILNYSEELAAQAAVAAGAGVPTGITVVDSNGRLNTTALAGADIAAVTAGDKKVEINVPAANKLTVGAFNLAIAKDFVTDNAYGANKSAAQTVTVNFGQATNAFVIPATGISNTGNVITVNFGQPVKGGIVAGSASDRNNYKLDGKVLPEGTSIVLDATGTTAYITLPASESVSSSTGTPFAIEGVQNASGVTNTTVAKVLTLVDNTAPVFTKLTFDAYDTSSTTSTFTLEFNEALATIASATAVTAGEIKLKVDGVDVSLASATVQVQSVTGFANKYKLTIAGVAIDTVKPVTITIGDVSTNVIKDTTNNGAKAGVSQSATK